MPPMHVHVRACARACARVRSLVSIGCLLALLGGAVPVRAAGDDEARAFLEKAKTAFALSHYAQAADYFEKAFELKDDPALLYNAAQSHRLAGNKERALALFQNYLRVFDRDARYAQIVARIDELKRAIEHDRQSGLTAPPPVRPSDATSPNGPAPATAAVASPAAASPPPAAVASTPAPLPALAPGSTSASASSQPTVLVSAPPAEGETPITHKPWFWGVVGGVVAVAVTVVLVVALSKTNDPSASLGSANGN